MIMIKKEMYAKIIEVIGASEVEGKEEILEMCSKEVERLSTKKLSKKTRERKEEDAVIEQSICQELVGGQKSAAELVGTTGVSSQKLTAIVKGMIESGIVEKETIKGRVFYSLVTEVADVE